MENEEVKVAENEEVKVTETEEKAQERIDTEIEQEATLEEQSDGATEEELEEVEQQAQTQTRRRQKDWSEQGFVDAKSVKTNERQRDIQRVRQLIRSGEPVELIQIAYDELNSNTRNNDNLTAVFTFGKSALKVIIPLKWFFQTVHTEPVPRSDNPSAPPRDPYFVNRLNLSRFVGSKVKMVFKEFVKIDPDGGDTPENITSVFASRLEANQRLVDRYFFNPDIEPPQEGDYMAADIVAVSPAVCHVNIFGVDATISRRNMDYQYIEDLRRYFHPGEKIHVQLTSVNVNEEDHRVRISASRRNSPQVIDKSQESIKENYIKPGMRINGVVTHIGESFIIVGFHHQDPDNENGIYDPNPEEWYGDAFVTFGFEIKRPILGDVVIVNITNVREITNPETGEKRSRIYGRLVSQAFLNIAD